MKPADEDAMAACEDDAVALHEVLGVSVILAGEVVDVLVTTAPGTGGPA